MHTCSDKCGTGNIDDIEFDDVNVDDDSQIDDTNDLELDTESVTNELQSIIEDDLRSKSRPTSRSSSRPHSRPNSRASSNASLFGDSQEVRIFWVQFLKRQIDLLKFTHIQFCRDLQHRHHQNNQN